MINILDYDTINKIAAGEVIERPASAVKELCENALDAGATQITVEIRDGGKTLIRVTDNGCGIERSEVKKAFLSHATSKIKNADDLIYAMTLGFRGEALSSIASVSETEMLTKRKGDILGTRYVIKGGIEQSEEDTGCPDGTTILVRNLFYNTPARKKFLKTDASEVGYVGDFIEKTAISHPEVAFRFISQGKTLLSTSGNGKLKDVIYTVFGRDTAASLVEINYEGEDISVSGFIGKPSVCRGNRACENYYINRRYIKSNIIARACEDAYAPYVMKHKYPFTALLISVNTELVDVNVHPAKLEVRFENPERMYTVINTVIMEALSKRDQIPTESEKGFKSFSDVSKKSDLKRFEEYKKGAEIFEQKRIEAEKTFLKPAQKAESVLLQNDRQNTSYDVKPEISRNTTEAVKSEAFRNTTAAVKSEAFRNTADTVTPEMSKAGTDTKAFRTEGDDIVNKVPVAEAPEQLSLFREEKETLLDRAVIIGQLFKTYWIVEIDNVMYILDQHAAHEKILYEKFLKEFNASEHYSQSISPPAVIKLTSKESAVLAGNLEKLTSLGFEISNFGGTEYIVSGIPVNIPGLAEENALTEFICMFSDEAGRNAKSEDIDHRLATMACKAAVKGNNSLTRAEAENLIKQLLVLDNPFNCPHGRPVIISMTKSDIERKFKRQL